jgi:hypothetical protein
VSPAIIASALWPSGTVTGVECRLTRSNYVKEIITTARPGPQNDRPLEGTPIASGTEGHHTAVWPSSSQSGGSAASGCNERYGVLSNRSRLTPKVVRVIRRLRVKGFRTCRTSAVSRP